MNYTLTLVASSSPLLDEHFHQTAKQLNIKTNDISWLDQRKAADMPLAACLNIEQVQKLRQILNSNKIDIFCTRTENRRKKLLLADMDSTIVTSETLDEIGGEAGIKDQIASMTKQAMYDDLDFSKSVRQRVALLKGRPAHLLERTLNKMEISKGAHILIQTMRSHDSFCALVSGGFTYFTQNVEKQLGFNASHGNIITIENDIITGEVPDPIIDKTEKLRLLKEYTKKQEIELCDSVAIGDGANDLPMLKSAGLGIGYHPKPLLEKELINCIRHTDLTSALYVQGYKKEEFSL